MAPVPCLLSCSAVFDLFIHFTYWLSMLSSSSSWLSLSRLGRRKITFPLLAFHNFHIFHFKSSILTPYITMFLSVSFLLSVFGRLLLQNLTMHSINWHDQHLLLLIRSITSSHVFFCLLYQLNPTPQLLCIY